MPRIGEPREKSQKSWAFLGAQTANWYRDGTGPLFEVDFGERQRRDRRNDSYETAASFHNPLNSGGGAIVFVAE
jgi:hypothetical protein